MKTRVLILLVMMSFLLQGCDFGRGAPKYNSTWNYTFGKSELDRMPTQPVQPAQPQATVQPEQHRQPRVRMVRRANHNVVSQTYPCGSCGVMRLDRWMPAEVQRNVPFMYTIKVVNLTSGTVNDVVVHEDMADNFKVIGSDPQAQIQARTLIWALGAMAPNASKEITVQGTATSDSTVLQCATMTYVLPAYASTNVVHTELLVATAMPDEALLCDTIPMRIGVKNVGSAVAHNVVIHDPLPAGMTSVNGETELTFNVGSLQPGRAREYPVDLKVSRIGVYENMATATSANGMWVKSTPVGITVRQPVLEITKSGPVDRYTGRPVSYRIRVANRGNALAENLTVMDAVPAGMTFISADNHGVLSNDKVVWHLPPLTPSQAQIVNVTYRANRQGTFESQAVAQALCADPVGASAQTTVRGIAAVLLEVIDLDDPVEVGTSVTYLVSTTNQGSSDSTNIRIVCTLEENMAYASSDGPTLANVQGPKISFVPLARLAPGAKATWKITVNALEPGDVRFRATLNTDQLSRPVEETESTVLYK